MPLQKIHPVLLKYFLCHLESNHCKLHPQSIQCRVCWQLHLWDSTNWDSVMNWCRSPLLFEWWVWRLKFLQLLLCIHPHWYNLLQHSSKLWGHPSIDDQSLWWQWLIHLWLNLCRNKCQPKVIVKFYFWV